MSTIAEAVTLAVTPPTAHEFDAHGHTYRIMLPAHRSAETSAYYEQLLTNRIGMGYINERATAGVIAGAYSWERVA